MDAKLNAAKLKAAICEFEPKSIMENLGINTVRRLVDLLPVVLDADIEDGEDAYDILVSTDWGDEAQRKDAEIAYNNLVDLIDGCQFLQGDGSNLGMAIAPMPRRVGPMCEQW